MVVLTHDLVFLYYLREKAGELGVEACTARRCERAYHAVGVVAPRPALEREVADGRLKALRHGLKSELRPLFKGNDPRYGARGGALALDLRKAYERLIEVYVLGGTSSARPATSASATCTG